jgi:hypothetical protein
MCNLKKIDVEVFQSDLRCNIQRTPPTNPSAPDDIDSLVKNVTIAIQNSVNKQKQLINHDAGKIKPWCNSGPLLYP